MSNLWKENWGEAKQHFIDWWNRKGIILISSNYEIKPKIPHDDISPPSPAATLEQKYTDALYRAQWNRYFLSRQSFEADTLPIASTDIGPGSLAIFIGSKPVFQEDTVWYDPCIENPEKHAHLELDPENKWWKITLEIIKENLKASKGNYFVGCPDLIENIDILASLRGIQELLIDMIERPEWVKEKVDEINQVWFEAYRQIYDLIKLQDKSSCFGAFMLWGPGRTAKVQCDASAMFSPEMFDEFVLPSLKKQCEWLDHSIYHLDGSEAICHLDSLLKIEALDGIEFTPEPKKPCGSDPYWYDLYRKILNAGKSIQIVWAKKEHLISMIKELGPNGIYIHIIDFENEDEIISARKEQIL